jgi:uncharacterized membrane protein HdeD (DUF308 family)
MSSEQSAGRSRGASIALGVAMVLLGLVVAAWPGITAVVLVRWLGIAVILYGFYELLQAVTGGEGSRLWAGLIGVVSVVTGAILFLTPIVSLSSIGTVIGVVWLVQGGVGLVGAIFEPGRRLLRALIGLISVVAGIAVLSQPGLSVIGLTWFAGLWMAGAGLAVALIALFGGRGSRAA